MHRLEMTLATAIVLGSCAWRYSHEDFRAEIGTDELITVEDYTWAGVNADGTRRPLDRLEDLNNPGKLSAHRMIIGMYCSWGRWSEPNNHVHNSLLANISLAIFHSTLSAIRVPALLAAAVFGFVSAYLCCRTGLSVVAPLVALICLWHPYVVFFSQQCRGYTLVLCFSVLLLLALQKVYEDPSGQVWAVIMALVAVATFQTMVNLIADWIAPLYISGIMFPSLYATRPISASIRQAIRSSLLLQFIGLLAVGAVFFGDRLPYLYSSAKQYGIPVSGYGEACQQTVHFISSLFPGAGWKAFALVAICGIAISFRSRHSRILVYPYMVALALSCLHYLATWRFPYERNAGVFLPLFVFGFACAVQAVVELVTSRLTRGIVLAMFWGGTVLLLFGSSAVTIKDRQYDELTKLVSSQQSGDEPATLMLMGHGIPGPVRLHRPSNWSTAVLEKSDRAVQIAVIEKKAFPFAPSRQLEQWSNADEVEVGPYCLWKLRAVACDLQSESRLHPLMVLWYPPYEAVSVTPDPVLRKVVDSGLMFHEIHERYQAKLEVFDRLKCLVFLIDSPTDSFGVSGKEPGDAVARFREIAHEVGGDYVALRPVDSRRWPSSVERR